MDSLILPPWFFLFSLDHMVFLIFTLGVNLTITPCLSFVMVANNHQIAKKYICAKIMTTNDQPFRELILSII